MHEVDPEARGTDSNAGGASDDEFVSIRVECENSEWREIASAGAFEAGAGGAVEEDDGSLTLYVPSALAGEVREAVREAASGHCRVAKATAIEARAWDEDWKRHLAIVEISPALRIRPSVLDAALPAEQREVVIEPGQAFGIGGHASTRLALEWVDILTREDVAHDRLCEWLDVGTGTGVLAFAALVLGAPSATGCDIDPLATRAAESAARANGLGERFHVFDSLDAVRSEPGFERAVANLLKREVLPLCDAIAARVAPGGRVVLAGLLDRDEAEVCEAFARHGIRLDGRREIRDADGETWVGLSLAHSVTAD